MRRQIFLPLIHHHPYFCLPEAVGWYKEEKHHYVNRTKNEMDNFNLHIVVDGEGYIRRKDEMITLKAGDCFLYFPSEEQYYYAKEENPWEVLWVHFSGNYLREFLIEHGFHTSNVWTLKSFTRMNELMIQLLEEAEQHTILHPSVLSMLTYGILSEFIAQAVPLSITRTFDRYNQILAILPKMREESYKPFDLKRWSDQLKVSTYYFCRIFKKTTGMSTGEFITLCRIQRAKQLLIERKDWTVKQIALETGYPSISYFGKLFLENEGVTPQEYRKKLLSE